MSGEGADPVPPGGDAWRSFRCPVCGHTDEAEVAEGQTLRMRCGHCETPLEVEGKGAGTGRVSVHVAGDGPPDGGSG